MDIIVEVGTAEQQELIRKELAVIKTVNSFIKPPLSIRAIIVPDNFDKKINVLQKTTDYESLRANHQAVAKTLTNQEGTFLIFSPLLYTQMCDNFERLQFYIHEFLHVVNRRDFSPFKEKKVTERDRIYLENLYILFDEYDVDRKSLEIIGNVFPLLKSKLMRNSSRYIKGMIRPLLENDTHYNAIRSEIDRFRIHGKVNELLDKTAPYFDEISKILIHSYSIIDHYPKFNRFLPFLDKSKFVNKRLHNLMEYYRIKYKNRDPDLFDGINIMSDFMQNFGVKFTNITKGLYCHVNDI